MDRGRGGFAGAIEHPELRALGVYLEELAGEGGLPRPQDFDIVRVPQLAGYIHMIDVEAGPRFRFAVYGTRIGDITESHYQGAWVDEMEPADRREMVTALLRGVLAEARPRYEPRSRCPELRRRYGEPPPFGCLAWPMARDGRHIDRVLVSLAPTQDGPAAG